MIVCYDSCQSCGHLLWKWFNHESKRKKRNSTLNRKSEILLYHISSVVDVDDVQVFVHVWMKCAKSSRKAINRWILFCHPDLCQFLDQTYDLKRMLRSVNTCQGKHLIRARMFCSPECYYKKWNDSTQILLFIVQKSLKIFVEHINVFLKSSLCKIWNKITEVLSNDSKKFLLIRTTSKCW